MKTILVVAVYTIGLLTTVVANTKLNAKSAVSMSISLTLCEEFLLERKPLPSSWDDIPTFRKMKKNLSQQNPNELKVINMLAIVPGAPIIEPDAGIPPELEGKRLFAISRVENTNPESPSSGNRSNGGGRYSIIISPNEPAAIPMWIPEVQALIVFRQLKDFDPAKQPVAFDNVDQLARDKETKQDQLNQQIREHLKKTGKHASDSQMAPNAQNPKGREVHPLPWIAGSIIVGAFLVWIAMRSRTLR